MSKGKLLFKESDVTRALRAAQKAGLQVARFEIDHDGKIVVVSGEPAKNETTNNPWDELYCQDKTPVRQ